MAKPLLLAALATAVALLACSNPSPAPTGTPTRAPSPTQEPTATAARTATPVKLSATEPTPLPTATSPPEPTITSTLVSTPKDETPTGVLSPLVLDDPMYDDPESVNALLSQTELACIKEIGPVMHLRWNGILQGYGDQEERIKIIGCLEDEILARVFLADTVGGVGLLSLETSICLHAAFNEIDPRSMMLAHVEGYPEDTLSSATTLHFVTMACLNDAEWETTAEWVREGSEIRAWMQCMMEKLGGPREMAVAMTKGGRGDQGLLAEAAADCAEEMGPAPSEMPSVPAATPESASTSEPSSIAPLDPDDPAGLLPRLSQEERDCVTDFELLADFLSKHPDVDYEDVAQHLECLEDETLWTSISRSLPGISNTWVGCSGQTRNPAFETPWMASTSATISGRYTLRKTTWSGRPTAKSGY